MKKERQISTQVYFLLIKSSVEYPCERLKVHSPKRQDKLEKKCSSV